MSEELDAAARTIIDSNLYMTLGTADREGRPWVSPVYFAAEGYADFLWVSKPEATHSRNLLTRPEVSIVIFDSQVPISTGQGVYMSAIAEEVADADLVVASRSTPAGRRPTEASPGPPPTCGPRPVIGSTGRGPPSSSCSMSRISGDR